MDYKINKLNDLIAGNIYMEMPCHTHTIASCDPAMPCPIKPWQAKEQEGNNPMHTNINANTSITSTTNIEATQRDYLVSRLRTIRRELRESLGDQFHLNAQAAPKGAKALVEAIKNDEFSFDEKLLSRIDEDELRYYNSLYGIIWGKETPDRDGFKKAEAALEVRYQEAIDAATLGPIDQAQQVIKDFQDWKYSAD